MSIEQYSRTKRVEIGTDVTCLILRYNRAIISQAFATMNAIHSSRIFIGLRTGEAMKTRTNLGFHVYKMSSSPDEQRTMRMYADKLIPYVRCTYGAAA